MKLSHSFILLSSFLLQSASAQNVTLTNCTDIEAAAATCTTTHNCTVVDDMNASLNCSGIKEEHCEFVEGCTECKEEIYALYDCKYGATCGMGIEAACLEEHHDDEEEEHHDDEDDHGHTTMDEEKDEHHDDHHDDHGHDDHDDDHDDEEKKEDDHHDDDHGDDHHGHDHGHEGDDHSDDVKPMAMDSPSSAPIRGVVAAALAIAAGSLMIA